MATSHYRQTWVLLNHPEFRMSPGNPNFRASPYPNFVMYAKEGLQPRSMAPGYDGNTAPGMKSGINGLIPPVAHRIHDGLIEKPSSGTLFLNQAPPPPPPPHPHGVSGSTPGYTQSGVVPKRPTITKQSMFESTVDRGSIRAAQQASRRSETVDRRRHTGPPSQASYEEMVRSGQQMLIAKKRPRQPPAVDVVQNKSSKPNPK